MTTASSITSDRLNNYLCQLPSSDTTIIGQKLFNNGCSVFKGVAGLFNENTKLSNTNARELSNQGHLMSQQN